MLLLAYAATVVSGPDFDTCNHGNWRPKDVEAECRIGFGDVPELVRFRSVRIVGDYVCGEVNQPGLKRMTGYRPFAFLDRDNYAEKAGEEYIAVLNGKTSGISLGDRMRDAIREGNTLEAEGYRIRKVKYDAAARELLSRCNRVGTSQSPKQIIAVKPSGK
jgi:hypothetical protein